MNPVAIRLLNQQLIAPQFSTPTEVVRYMDTIVIEINKYHEYRRLSRVLPVIRQ